MKIVDGYPPNFKAIQEVFTDIEKHKPCFCYGDTIYNPYGIDISPDLEHHESIHTKQQASNPELWWYNYLYKKDFRLSQELEAYGEQYLFVKKHVPNNRLRKWKLEHFAKAVSSELYGNLITYYQAESAIRNYGKEQPK